MGIEATPAEADAAPKGLVRQADRLVGSFYKVSAKYMRPYVAEFQFRYNNRFNDDIFGTAIEGC